MSLHNLVWDSTSDSATAYSSTKFASWAPGDTIAQQGERLLIGVARWSLYDQQLLSLLESLTHSDCQVDLFDADNCKSQEAIRDYIPQIGFVHHTPIVGYWRDGAQIESQNGYAGRHLIYRVLGLDPVQADKIVLQRRHGAPV